LKAVAFIIWNAKDRKEETMGWILLIIGVVLLVLGGTKNKSSLRKSGYSIDDQDKGFVPLDGSVIPKTSSLLILAGWGCLIIGGIILAFSFF
jgi:hypothetical protein